MLALTLPGFTPAQINSMPKGPDTIDGVLKEWDPSKIAWHALFAGDPRGYMCQSAYLATMSLYAVGASKEQILAHIEAIIDAYKALLQHGEVRGRA